MICPTCGTENRPTARFCTGCGAPMQEEPMPQRVTPPPSDEPPSQQQQALRDLSQTVAKDLESGKNQGVIVKQLTKQGWSKESAQQFVANVARELKEYRKTPAGRSALAEKYKSRIIRGLLWTIAGIVITVLTYSAASEGGTYFICWGAILLGIIDFVAGLIGWLRYQL